MSINLTPIELLVQHAVLYLKNNGYSNSSVQRYHKCWRTLLDICLREHIQDYCYEQCFPLMFAEWGINLHDTISPFQRFQIRSLKCLRDFQNKGAFSKCYRDERTPTRILNTELMSEYENHLKQDGLKTSTILSKKYAISHFLQYQPQQGMADISAMSPEFIIQYLHHVEQSALSPSTKGRYLSSIKRFLEYLYLRQKLSMPLHRMLAGNSFSKYVRLPSQYKQDESKAMLSAIDRDSARGKRDYLIMLLTARLGIRAGDLCRLKLENIRWETERIQFVQQKTESEQILPLPENVKYALLDYLKNSRPQTAFPHIFIRSCAPYTPYEDTNPFYNIVKKYMELAGIDHSGRKHGLHAMRHSLAGNLLTDGVEFPVISSILGHAGTETTMRYAGIDITALRRIALEVPYER